jgi:hypothetical protein
MMLASIDRLAQDPATEVIVLLSKPPSPAVAQNVIKVARAVGKPIVVNFLGGDPGEVRRAGLIPADTLEEAARLAVARARGETMPLGLDSHEVDLSALALDDSERLGPGQGFVRGLYSGGTLCKEAGIVLHAALGPRYGSGHRLVDLGDDEYTVGRPHPMIDFRLRNEHIVAAAEDPTTAVILLDIVLGFGSHPDPAEALRPAIRGARERVSADGRRLSIVGSVCGTDRDPQGLARQEGDLREQGVLLAPSNAQAARLAAAIILGDRHDGGAA